MDAKTLEALKGSIAKWEAIVAGTGWDQGPGNCPLCILFHKVKSAGGLADDSCIGCPVMAATGERGCAGSPYEKYEDLDLRSDDGEEVAGEKEAAAQAELDFLRSLLPEDAR